MTCPAENTWIRYVGGGLPSAHVSDLEAHLDRCSRCRAVFAHLAKGSGAATDPNVHFDPYANPHELVRGSLVDRYVVVGTLGRGGMGVVYKAFDPELDRSIALKLVALHGFGSEAAEARVRLLREAKTLAQLSHPNVVGVHDVGSHDDDVFVAMEFVAGQTLRQWLAAAPRAPREILAVFHEAAAGLAAAHEVGIVHRDFKPENVMVGNDGRVRVLDFGLARASRPAARPSLPSLAREVDAALTDAGAIMGTPAYMAPEQDLGHEVDGRSDQFSFCAALYEALYGQRPFEGRTYVEIATHRIAGDLRPPPVVRGVSSQVRSALLRGMAVAPAKRFPSMHALRAELGPARRRTKVALAALTLVSLVAGGWATWVAINAPPTIEDLCASAGDEVTRVWSPQRRGEVLAKFELEDRRAVGERVVAAFDHYASEWTARRVALCKLARAGDAGFERDQKTSSRMQCLRTRLTTFDGSVSVFTHTTNDVITARAEAIVKDLPALASCDIEDTTNVVTEATRDRWQPMVQELVDGHVALGQNKLDDAERLATAVLARARKDNEREPLAASLVLLGQTQARKGLYDEAKATLLEAVHVATDVREEGMVVQSWIEILQMAFSDRRLLNELEYPLVAAEVAALRLASTNPLRTQLAYTLGTVRLLRGEHEQAAPQLEQTLAIFNRDPEKHVYDIAGVETSLGVVHMLRGEWEASHRLFESARTKFEAMPMLHPNLATTTGWLGDVLAFQHDFVGAEPYFVKAIALLEQMGDVGKPSLPKVRFQLGYVHARAGQCAKARPLFAKARTAATAQGDRGLQVLGLVLLGEAHCKIAKGEPRRAIPLLARANELAAIAPAQLLQAPYNDFTLARALMATGQDKPRALALAKRARDSFARFAGTRADREAVEVWLAKHAKPERIARH